MSRTPGRGGKPTHSFSAPASSSSGKKSSFVAQALSRASGPSIGGKQINLKKAMRPDFQRKKQSRPTHGGDDSDSEEFEVVHRAKASKVGISTGPVAIIASDKPASAATPSAAATAAAAAAATARVNKAVFTECWSMDRADESGDDDGAAAVTASTEAAAKKQVMEGKQQHNKLQALKDRLKLQQQQQHQQQQNATAAAPTDDAVDAEIDTETASASAGAKKKSKKNALVESASASASDLKAPRLIGGPGKLTGWAWFRSIGSPRFVLSPMVGQSELAYRLLCRRHGASLAYTPMIIASRFVESAAYRKAIWQTCPQDRPLVVQLCASDPATLVAAGKLVEGQCDAVDLNLGCPQSVAQRGGYGAYLMEKQSLIQAMVSAAAAQLAVPITVKIRVFPDYSRTASYTRMLEQAGASLITIHGRLRHQREEVLADWSAAPRLRAAAGVPVVLNGDVWHAEDVANCLSGGDIDGIMSAQGILHNPAIFEPLAKLPEGAIPFPVPQPAAKASPNGALALASATRGPAEWTFQAPVADDRLRQRRVISPFLSFALNAVFNHPLSRSKGATGADTSGSGVLAGGSAGPAAAAAAALAAGRGLTKKELAAAFAAAFSTPDEAVRQFNLAEEYLDIVREYPPYHNSQVRRHLFFMLFDNFQANLDQYDELCASETDAQWRDILHTLRRRAEAGVNKRTKNAFGGGGERARARRRDGTVAPPPWPTGGGGMNVAENGKGGEAVAADAKTGPGSGSGKDKGKNKGKNKGKGKGKGDYGADGVDTTGMSAAEARAAAKAAAAGLDPSRLKHVDLSRFD